MDASFTTLPIPAQEYLHWLREAHSSSDNWLRFERALTALQRYNAAKDDAERRKSDALTAVPASSTIVCTSPAANTHANYRAEVRRDLFLVLSRQIVAQEEMRIAIQKCQAQCVEETLSSDAERFLAWMQARFFEAEAEVRMESLLEVREKNSSPVSLSRRILRQQTI